MNNNKKTKKKRHNGEGSIRQKPNGRYEVRISGRDMETGKSTRISKYADTLDEAVDIQHALSVAMVQTPQYLQNRSESTRLNSSHRHTSRMPSSA